jgi:hypothetical protein
MALQGLQQVVRIFRMSAMGSNANVTFLADFLKSLSAEIRLKIYELVLPVDAFFSRRYPSADGAALILTCKLINREAYPLFISRNNFDIDYSLPFYYHAAHDFYKYVRQVSLEWSPKGLLDDETTALEVGKNNFKMIRYLYRFSKLQVLHIASFWEVDQEYLNLEDHCREDGAPQNYLERSGIKAFSEIPGLIKITFSHNPLSARGKSESMIALEKYMAEHLRDSQSGSWNF